MERGELFSIQVSPQDLKDYELIISGDTSHSNTIRMDILENNDKNQEGLAKVLFVRAAEEDGIKLYFQAIRQGSIIRKSFLYFVDNKSHIENKPMLVIQDRTDVFWRQKDGKLYFKKN
ncbi:hypothetical protein [Helicobacter labacensis]|uniref:hypothetical protein n=1 Tax=Helicobacter labacensis TaxID=2316079 RepID=UPI000EB3991A|nr:hypothetical protein [Helicobacter labacensis]